LDSRDEACLYKIKNLYGGSIKPIAGYKALRYRLHNKLDLINLINTVNGEIRNPVRLAQLFKLCDKYNIPLNYAKDLTYDNG